MMKPNSGLHTPRLRAAAGLRSSASSSSLAKEPDPTGTPVFGDSKIVPNCLADDLASASLASSGSSKVTTTTSSSSSSSQVVAQGLAYGDLGGPEFYLSPLDLPDPAAVFSPEISASDESVVVSATPSISSKSGAETVGDLALSERLRNVLAELEEAEGVSGGGKRLVSALVEAAIGELAGGAAARRRRNAAFWAKVRIGLIATMIVVVAAIDLALAVAIAGGGGEEAYGLPPT